MECTCPLCGQKVDFKHIVDDHIEYWATRGIDIRDMPKDAEGFNKRFGPLGMKIEEF